MRSLFFIILLALSPVEENQLEQIRIGTIDFFGCSGIDLQKVRKVLPIVEGDELSFDALGGKIEGIPGVIHRATGQPPSDIGVVCCDDNNDWVLYIGLSGRIPIYNSQPNGNIRLSEDILDLLNEFQNVYQEGAMKGILSEDQSRGYALSDYPPARAIQLKMRSFALVNEGMLQDVLMNSSDDRHRQASAQLIGYSRQSESQAKALSYAIKDHDEAVRNNALRALWLIVESKPEMAKYISLDNICELLQSGSWSDLNKASLLLSAMTKNRDRDMLINLCRDKVMERLIEIARWRFTGHSEPAKYILGRIAGIKEEELHQLVKDENLKEIIDKLPDSPENGFDL